MYGGVGSPPGSRQVPQVQRLGSAGYERNIPSPNGQKRDPATPSRVVKRKGTPPTNAMLVSLPDAKPLVQEGTPNRRPSNHADANEVIDDDIVESMPTSMNTKTPPRLPLSSPTTKPENDYNEEFESESEDDVPPPPPPLPAVRPQEISRPQHPSAQQGRPPITPREQQKPAAEVSLTESGSAEQPPTAPSPQRAKEMNINIGKKELIGRGQFGNVYKAMDEDSDRIIAVKEVILGSMDDLKDLKKQIHQLEREIRVMQKLRHPNIVQYLGAKRKGAELHIFMEFVTGGTITSLIKSFGAMKEQKAARYTLQLLRGLQYLHERKIAHRDLKGDNLFVEINGTLKLGDFGTSKEFKTMQMADTVAGTPNFMAPEVIACSGHSVEADIWSVGCCVIQMLRGTPPFFPADNQLAVMFKVSKGEIEGEIPDNISATAADFIRSCTKKDPADRPTVGQLLQHPWLEQARLGSAGSSRSTVPAPAAAVPDTPSARSEPQKAPSTSPAKQDTPPPISSQRRSSSTRSTPNKTPPPASSTSANRNSPPPQPRELRRSSSSTKGVGGRTPVAAPRLDRKSSTPKKTATPAVGRAAK